MHTAAKDSNNLLVEVATAIPVLDVMSTQLQQTAGQIETAVVDVCNRFQSMVERSRAGVTSAADLLDGNTLESSGTSIGALIEKAKDTIEALLRQTEQSVRVSQNAIESINRVRNGTDQIAKSLAQLDDITVGNRLLAVNARIQAVYAGERAAGFGGVANEIASQARHSSEIVDLIRNVSDELRTIAQSTLADLQAMAGEDRKALETSKLAVDQVLFDFRRMHADTRQFIGRVTRENAAVADEISAAIRSLQFQDRVNKRMGHVVAELVSLRQIFSKHCQYVRVDSTHVLKRLSELYTMHEERSVVGSEESDDTREVELF